MQPAELTLIVAATRNMGIGFKGSMPWKGLRKEMQYFARVTTRVPPQARAGSINAVIMGRKTWDSIPPKFRPLKDRLNIVISRSAQPPGTSTPTPTSPPPPAGQSLWLPSLESALEYVRASSVARVFVMGGAQIYDAAIRLPQARRVLLTSIEDDFECDTFFPVDLRRAPEWTRRSREQLQDWTGETVDEGGQEEAGTRYEFQMWEKGS